MVDVHTYTGPVANLKSKELDYAFFRRSHDRRLPEKRQTDRREPVLHL
jgi:hypothetical protein